MHLRSWGISLISVLASAAFGCEHKYEPSTPGMASGGTSQTMPQTCEAPAPGPAPLHPLTRFQYNNIVRDLLGDSSQPAQAFPPENEVEGYRTMAAANQANPLLVQSYLNVAETV